MKDQSRDSLAINSAFFSLLTAPLWQVMVADKKASQAAEQTVAATMQPAQETSIPIVPLVATNSVEASPIKKKGLLCREHLRSGSEPSDSCKMHTALRPHMSDFSDAKNVS